MRSLKILMLFFDMCLNVCNIKFISVQSKQGSFKDCLRCTCKPITGQHVYLRKKV
jgi:hypothetical protein